MSLFRFTLISQPSNSQQLLRFGNRRSWDRGCISLVGDPWIGRTRRGGGVLGMSAFFLVGFELFDVATHTFLFQVMPSIIPLTYHFLLPSPSSFRDINTPSAYVPLATAEDDAEGVQEEEPDFDVNREFGRQSDLRGVEEQQLMIDDSNGKTAPVSKNVLVTLSANDKWRLVKPLLARYMLPLCTFKFLLLEPWFWMVDSSCCIRF